VPELPEAETIARDLSLLLAGRVVKGVEVLFPKIVGAPSLPPEAAENRRILGASRVGKMVLIELEGGLGVLASLRMTGQFVVLDGDGKGKGALPSSARAVLRLGPPPRGAARGKAGEDLRGGTKGAASEALRGAAKGAASKALRGAAKGKPREAARGAAGGSQAGPALLVYCDTRKFGRLSFLDAKGLAQKLKKLNHGPDALTAKAEDFHRLASSRRAPAKALLMDQSVIAGLGNIYATEALFAAGVSPLRPGVSLTASDSARLLREAKKILRGAIKLRGSTIQSYSAPLGPGRYQERHRAYGKAGGRCPVCGAAFRRAAVGGRGTVWCPVCQK
jgi:formamidopyrimidine-DNA glycosylase